MTTLGFVAAVPLALLVCAVGLGMLRSVFLDLILEDVGE